MAALHTHRPHRFPVKQYSMLLSSLHTTIGLLQTQLYSMGTGSFSLASISKHTGPICAAGMQLSATFAELSRLSYTPPSWRKGAVQRWASCC